MESRQVIPIEALRTRVGAAAALPDVLRDLGVEPQAVFDAAGVDIGGICEFEALAPIADLARLIRLSVQASGRTDLGLLIAGRVGAGAFGLLGRLVANADTLRTALQ